MRAKLRLHTVTTTSRRQVLDFSPAPDNTPAQYSPSANLSLNITDPALIGTFRIGENYDFDFSLSREAKEISPSKDAEETNS